MDCKLEISRFVEAYQPTLVEIRIVDAHGKQWTFVTKAPNVSSDDLDANSTYARPGRLECDFVERTKEGFIRVSFASNLDPDTIFDLRPDQIIGL
jgi:hypothetical protein